jgi:hypothetical protein
MEHKKKGGMMASNSYKSGISAVGQNQEGKVSPGSGALSLSTGGEGEIPIPETMKYALSAFNFIDSRCMWIDDR